MALNTFVKKISAGRPNSKIQKANQAIEQLCTWVLYHHYILLTTKPKVYTAAGDMLVLCDYKAWILDQGCIKPQFIMGIHKQDKIILKQLFGYKERQQKMVQPQLWKISKAT